MSMGQGPGGQGPPGQSGGGPPGQAGGAGTAGTEGGAAASTGIAGRRVGAAAVPDEREATGAPPRRGIETLDEPLGGPDAPEFEPFGRTRVLTTSNQNFTQVLDVSPGRGRTLLLDQVVIETGGKATALVTTSGVAVLTVQATNAQSFEWGGAKLPYGGHVRVLAKSEDGSEINVVANVIGREV